MKFKMILIFLIPLFLIAFLYSNTAIADNPYKTTDIKVSILEGVDSNFFFGYLTYKQKTGLDDYHWFAYDTQYKFSPNICEDEFTILKFQKPDYLDNKLTNVLVADGYGYDQIECSYSKILRNQYRNYIDNGGGFIGSCGGGDFPFPLYDEPNTLTEKVFIDDNSFIKETDMNTRADFKMGFPITAEYLGVVNRLIPIRLRWNLDPGAVGALGYSYYNIWDDKFSPIDSPIKNINAMKGIPVNLTDIDKTHAITKDFWGDSLFVNAGGGPSYIIDDSYVSCLASYPSNYCEGNELQKLNAWSFSPKLHGFLKELLTLFKINGFKQIYIDELPTEFQNLYEEEQEVTSIQELLSLLIPGWIGWEKTNDIIQTKYVDDTGDSKPAIIAFNFRGESDKGRLVLHGPHIFYHGCWWPGELINHNQSKNHRMDVNGMYHWEDPEDPENKWILDNKRFPNYVRGYDYTWLYRREVAWASGLVQDDHLPPVYGRSQVIDINPYMQTTSDFPIYCCVANGEEENWKEQELKLYYKFNEPTGWSSSWKEYNEEVVNGRPYKFNFDASIAEGDGLYRFCSVLTTTDNDNEVIVDDFPPMWDAEVLVNGDISSQFIYDIDYPYAKDSISFNSSESTTKSGTQITSYHWDFGDGSESWSQNPTHTYDDDGVYTVKLTVENNLSQTNYTNKTITIHNNPPNMNINSDNDLIFVNNNVNFTDISSDIDGNITSWYWDFGDGTNSTTRNTSHTYSNNGFYKYYLEVTDDDNSTNKEYGEVLVINSLVNQSRSQQGNIWNNIQDAINNASTYDLIYIENGSYSENIFINKTVYLIGEKKNNVIIEGSIVMSNPYDYELPTKETFDYLIVNNMTGIELLMHFNNDSEVGENYSSSNLVVDYSGQNNNGTNNGATWTTSTIKGEGAFYFDGIDDSINLSSISALTGENVTVSAWINSDSGNGFEYPILSQKNTNSGYCLFINNSTMKPCFKLDNDIAVSSDSIGNNEWQYIVGTHNETYLKIYVDGKLTGTTSKTGVGLDTLGFIGYDNNSNFFDGGIDEVAVWNRTLTDDEINLIFESNNGIKIESITLKDSNIGVTPCNHSQLFNCYLINHSIGILLNGSNNVMIQMCNITDTDIGIEVINSNPNTVYFNSIVDCSIDNITYAINVSNSKNLYVVGSMVNGSASNLSFSNMDMEKISIINSWSPNNVAPGIPGLSGPSQGDINISYIFYCNTSDSNNDFFLYFFDWGDGNNSGWIGEGTQGISNFATHKWMNQGGYYVKSKSRDIFDYESNWSTPILFKTENLTPLINSVSDSPDTVGFGYDVTITTNVTDDTSGNYSGIKTVKVNITYPDDSYVNASMTDIGNDTYQYVFSDTWLFGKYNYSIWAIDNAYNTNLSMGHSFNVSVDATISICTINNSYTDNCTVNLTDPPSSSYLVGYEFLDDGEVLHLWNNLDHYYFDTDSGIQLTNHYNEYWSQNVLMLGYYNNDEWNLIYRTDELSGFNKNTESDNETYVNATLWKNLNYEGYDFRLAIRYHLGVNDNELTVIPYIKNIDNEDIQYNLGFAWEIKDIQIDMTEENDYIEIDGTTYYLNTSGLDETYTNMDIPSFYIKEDITDTKSESLYLRWDENLNYKIQVKSRTGQNNAPVTLGIKIGTLSVGQEKYTEMYWYDACKISYYYNSYDTMLAWATNPAYMVDGNTANYASTTIDRDVEICNGNTCSGDDYGTISKVEIRAFGKYSGSGVPPVHDIVLKALSGNHYYSPGTTGAWSSWHDITNNPAAPDTWTWDNVNNLTVEVESSIMGSYTMYCSKIEVQVTYNINPTIYDPYPTNGANGITITPVLNISVNDADGDSMNIIWLSNSSGSWQAFGTNNSVGNGTYHQTFTNATVNGQWWYWKVNVSDGTDYTESNVMSFYTGYQSKIEDTGSTNFSGYLLMEIEFYNTTNSTWILEQVVVNESTPRTINIGSTLALDSIFNPNNVSTNSFTNGDGTYRVYAAFRDPDGDVLVCDDESLLEANYQFTASSS